MGVWNHICIYILLGCNECLNRNLHFFLFFVFFFREDDFYANMAAMSDDDMESDISEADVDLVAKSLDVSCFFFSWFFCKECSIFSFQSLSTKQACIIVLCH